MTIASLLATPTALYHRASSVDQDPGLARHELRAAARARGLEVVLEVEEQGSGARNDRPGLQRVLEAVRKGKVTCVMVHKLDRWGRSALDVMHNIRQLEEAGAEFVVTSQGLHIKPHGDSVSKLILNVLASVAEFERSLIVERTMLGLHKARRQGKRLGRRPTKKIPSFTQVAALRKVNHSWADIAKALGCAATTARRVHAQGCQIGLDHHTTQPAENPGAG
jgi:DNA invertase Pin-like site-specific DNA recombinase